MKKSVIVELALIFMFIILIAIFIALNSSKTNNERVVNESGKQDKETNDSVITLKGFINSSYTRCFSFFIYENGEICLDISTDLSEAYFILYNMSFFKFRDSFVTITGKTQEPNYFNETFLVSGIKLDSDNEYNKNEAYCKTNEECYGIYESIESGKLVKCINIYNENSYVPLNYTLGQISPDYCICKSNICQK